MTHTTPSLFTLFFGRWLATIPLLALLFGAGAIAADRHHHHADGAAIGKPGDAAKVERTVQVEMTDSMRFIPDRIEVGRGETVRFSVTNTGQLDHEFVLGTAAMLREHALHMKKSPGMKHDSAHHVMVAPGKTSEVVWQFTRPGTVEFACLVPGHFEAGMRGKVLVVE